MLSASVSCCCFVYSVAYKGLNGQSWLWGCGAGGDGVCRARCLVLPVCVCLWNSTAA